MLKIGFRNNKELIVTLIDFEVLKQFAFETETYIEFFENEI